MRSAVNSKEKIEKYENKTESDKIRKMVSDSLVMTKWNR